MQFVCCGCNQVVNDKCPKCGIRPAQNPKVIELQDRLNVFNAADIEKLRLPNSDWNVNDPYELIDFPSSDTYQDDFYRRGLTPRHSRAIKDRPRAFYVPERDKKKTEQAAHKRKGTEL